MSESDAERKRGDRDCFKTPTRSYTNDMGPLAK